MSAVEKVTVLRQRADYTHRHNTHTGRHGWLRLTPAYSLKIVEELISRDASPKRVLDPFCGTATTALSAAYHGHQSVTIDINPFLIWLGQAKVADYSQEQIDSTRRSCLLALDIMRSDTPPECAAPPIHNIERWWSPDALRFLCKLKGSIDTVTTPDSAERTLLSVAFCRTLILLSNASFSHQSMSFKAQDQLCLAVEADNAYLYQMDVDFVLQGAKDNPAGTALVVLGDSRDVSTSVSGQFDRLITSPPYANRMSYIRELRPYMYWLGYLENGRDAGELDWAAIGGTWGIATSRLTEWTSSSDALANAILAPTLDLIAHEDNKNGALLSKYVEKYFYDMQRHFNGLPKILRSGAEVHYIVGNSTFYGAVLPVEKLYAEMLTGAGFENVQIKAIRKRNSKKELVEFDVQATWPA